jgi:hypothetical protein
MSRISCPGAPNYILTLTDGNLTQKHWYLLQRQLLPFHDPVHIIFLRKVVHCRGKRTMHLMTRKKTTRQSRVSHLFWQETAQNKCW